MKKTVILVLALLMAISLAGCGKEESSASSELHLDANSKQYSDYAEALLKAIYTKDYSDYINMTGEAENVVQNIYNNHVANTADELREHFNIPAVDGTDRETINGLVAQLYNHMNYRVTNVQLDSQTQNYVVTIEVDKLNFVKQVDDTMDAYLKEMNRKMANRELDNMTAEEYDLQYKAKAMEAMQSAIGSLSSSEKCSVQLPFRSDSSGAVSISEDTLHVVTRKLLGL